MSKPKTLVSIVLVALVVGPATLAARQAGDPAPPATSAAEWPSHGRDAAEQRYSPLDRITRLNVGRLGVAWSWEIPRRGARLESTPLVADGVLYATGPMSTVFALDARTGVELWSWDPGIPDEEQGGPSVCCGDVNRGVALHGDRVFAGLLDGRLVALDRHTGRIEWSVQTTPAGRDYSITGAPRVLGDRVVIGNAGAEYGVRGYVTAYAVDDGAQLWRTYTVPGNPADGFESEAMRAAAETWTGEWWEVGGGGTVWDAMAYDSELDLLYIGTGNGSPWSRDHRSPGGGDNLYLSSIVALDGRTGEYRWHYQTTPGDDWDYTATQPLMLLDLEIAGRDRKVIVQAPKNGFFYVIDRITGEFLSGQAFADEVTWATHIDEGGRPVEAPAARYGRTGGAWLAPGPTGAHNWPPMAWNPATGLVYTPAKNNNFYYEMTDGLDYVPGQWNTGTVFGSAGGERPERPEVTGSPTMLVAWDPAQGREVWRAPTNGDNGGALSTGGGLVFWGTESRLVAFDAWTGDELWSAEVGRGTASPITYEIDGRQFVTILAGRAVTGARPDADVPTVWTFTLDGEGMPADDVSGPDERAALRARIEALEELRTRQPDDPTVTYRLGSASLELAGLVGGTGPWYGKAEEALVHAFELDPGDPKIRAKLASLFAKIGRPEESVTLLVEGLEQHPDDPSFHEQLGYVLRYAGLMEESMASYRRSQELDPSTSNLVASQDQITKSLIYLGDYDEALESHRRMLAFAERGGRAVDEKQWFYEGVIHLYRGDAEAAAHAFRSGRRLDPTTVWTTFGHAYEAMALGDTARVAEVLGELERRDVVDGERHYRLVHFSAFAGDGDRALDHLRQSTAGGFFNAYYLETDPWTESLRARPDFQAIVESARARGDDIRGRMK